MLSDIQKVKFNRIALLIVSLLLIGFLIGYGILKITEKLPFQAVYLYFPTNNYKSLNFEKYSLRKDLKQHEKMKRTIEQLISGPTNYHLRSAINIKTKLRSLWYFNKELHINFSNDIKKLSNIEDDKLVVYSILLTIFKSFSEVQKIKLYVNDKPLQSILGWNSFNRMYKKDVVFRDAKDLFQDISKK